MKLLIKDLTKIFGISTAVVTQEVQMMRRAGICDDTEATDLDSFIDYWNDPVVFRRSGLRDKVAIPEAYRETLGPGKKSILDFTEERNLPRWEVEQIFHVNGILSYPKTATDEEFDAMIIKWQNTSSKRPRAGAMPGLTDVAIAKYGTMKKFYQATGFKCLNWSQIATHRKKTISPDELRIIKELMGTPQDVDFGNTPEDLFKFYGIVRSPELEKARDQRFRRNQKQAEYPACAYDKSLIRTKILEKYGTQSRFFQETGYKHFRLTNLLSGKIIQVTEEEAKILEDLLSNAPGRKELQATEICNLFDVNLSYVRRYLEKCPDLDRKGKHDRAFIDPDHFAAWLEEHPYTGTHRLRGEDRTINATYDEIVAAAAKVYGSVNAWLEAEGINYDKFERFQYSIVTRWNDKELEAIKRLLEEADENQGS